MQLSQDIIFFRLLVSYPCQFFNRNESRKRYSYPIIYEAGVDLTDHVIVIHSDDLAVLLERGGFERSLFVCIGNNPDLKPDMPPVIMIEENIPLISVNNFLIKTYDEFEKWDDSLNNVISKGGSFQDLVNCCEPILHEPIAIIDKDFHVVAESEKDKKLDYDNESEEEDASPDNSYAMVINETDPRDIKNKLDSYILPAKNGRHIGRNIFYRNEFAGRIAVHLRSDGEPLENYCNAIIVHFHTYVVKLYNEFSSFEVREASANRLATLLRNKLNNKRISEKLWEEAFAENGWDKNNRFLLVQFLPHSLNDLSVRDIYTNILNYKTDTAWNESLCFIYRERVLLLINMERFPRYDNPELFEALGDFSKSNHLAAGISRVFVGMKYLRSAYEQTKTAIEYGTTDHPSDSCYLFEKYALEYMLRNCIGSYESDEICSSKLLTLMQYDREKGTDYYKTLYTYFRCRYNAVEAAKQLFINRSTFHYRLERIQELAKIDFNSDDERLYLAISCKILEQSQDIS